MAKRRNKKFGLASFIVLVLVTVIGWAALNATNNLSNPFGFGLLLMDTPPIEEDGGFQMIQLDDLEGVEDTSNVTDAELFEMPERGTMPEMSYTLADYFNFSWQDFGQVLYNVWLLLALTVAVIVIARPVGWLVKRFKSATQNQTKRLSARQNMSTQ